MSSHRQSRSSSNGFTGDIPSVLPGLVDKGLGGFLDEALRKMVIEHKDDIHEIVDSIIAQTARSTGKGMKAIGGSGGSTTIAATNVPLRKMAPTSVDLRHDCHTSANTRSIIEPMHERKDSAITVGDQFNEAVEECKEAVAAIVTACKRKKIAFFDESFYYDRDDNVIPAGSPADCTVGKPTQAIRLRDLFEDVVLFADDVTADDIVQGQVGDCFLIGAISALAASFPSQIKNLFAAYDLEVGVFGVMFFKCGSWEWVVVDDLVPIGVERSGFKYPLFASSSGERKELWPMVLEKAYAKMHYNWDMIDGGWAKEALVDMTGGLEFTVDFHREHKDMSFDKFHEQVANELTVLGCAVGDHVGADSSKQGGAGEQGALFGLYHGHQYAVIESKETSDGTGFVRVRNPWGNDAEWTGPYADNSKEWMENADHKRELNPEFKDDGAFWIRWSDFKYYLSLVDVVRTFSQSAQTLTIYGAGVSYRNAANTFILQVCDTPTKMAIALCQDDPKMKYGRVGDHKGQYKNYASMKLEVYKLRDIPKKFEDIEAAQQMRIVSRMGRDRSVHTVDHLDPGLYSVVAMLKSVDKEELGMFIRIIAAADADYSLYRWADGESKRLVIGECPLIGEVGDLGIEAVSRTSPRDGASRSPSIIAIPSLALNTTSKAEVDKLKKDLLDNADYVKQLETLITKQQRQIESLNSSAAQQGKPSSSQHRDAAASTSPAAAAPSVVPTSPWGRLRITKSRWDEIVDIVYREVSMRGEGLSADEALNGVRLLVTAGCGLDDVCVSHPSMGAAAQVGSRGLSKREFEGLCTDALMKWNVLGGR